MIAPNNDAWKKDIRKDRCSTPRTHIKTAMTIVETAVPTKASIHIPPRLFKNLQGPSADEDLVQELQTHYREQS